MIPDELPNPPRKASWKRWSLVLACVLAIGLVVLFLKAPTPERVSVTFVGSTNYNGQRTLVFKGTNGLPRDITYWAFVGLRPTKARSGGVSRRVYGDLLDQAIGAGETFTFALHAPEN